MYSKGLETLMLDVALHFKFPFQNPLIYKVYEKNDISDLFLLTIRIIH
ncbi:unknown [Bacteroides sp. CAG:189]|nr:unknown [Bacteroides sp. CAG:189]